jgi:hypothetical protein
LGRRIFVLEELEEKEDKEYFLSLIGPRKIKPCF